MRRVAAAAFLMALPTAALAHASERAIILTLPTGHYILGAGIIVALTAVVAALKAGLPALHGRSLWSRRRLLPPAALGWVATATLFALVIAGLAGSRDPFANPLPLMLWTVIWVGLTVAVACLGDLWRPINPWRAPVRSLRAFLGSTGSIGLGRLGHWPAVAGYFSFAWLEIVSVAPDDPGRLALVVAAYWGLIFALAVAEGEDWLDKGEFLSVYFGFIALVAPIWSETRHDRITTFGGWPGTRILASAPLDAGAIAFVTLLIASVSFDGIHETFWWLARIGLNPLDFPGRSAVVQINSVGLALAWAGTTALILGAVWFGLRLAAPPAPRFAEVIGPLTLSFLPIAAGYHIAHYLVALLTQGQYAISALDDPLQRGDHLFGLPEHWVSFGFLARQGPVQLVWQTQVAIILGAHLLAVLLGETIARRLVPALPSRALIPVVVLMVLYTMFGLWLLSAPAVG